MKEKILSKKYLIFCLALSFVALMFTSKNSFLYEFNDWVDANAFFTVGKGMFRGTVPYKDLFEQKGIFLYFIYGIGSLFSYTNFHGVFILEVISFSVFLYYAHKIFSLYFDKKFSLIVLPIISYLMTCTIAFVHGGSCEEFALPFLMISIYYYFKHFKVEKLTDKEVIINGILCSLVFLMKYTMIGLWIGFGLFILIDYLKDKDYKKGIRFCLYFLLGFLIPIFITLIYLLLNHALKDFIECYFVVNITAYGDNTSNLLRNAVRLCRGFFGTLELNSIPIRCLILLLPISLLFINKDSDDRKIKKDILFKLGILSMMVFTVLVIYWGLKFFTYYLLPVIMFSTIAILGISLYFKKYIDKLINKKYVFILIGLINIIFIILTYYNANYSNVRGWTKKAFFQFKYAEYINKYEDPTLLNMGFLDGGLYTTTGIIPNVRYFEEQNINPERFPDNSREMKKAVKEKKVKFILFYTQQNKEWLDQYVSYLYDDYELIFDDNHYFENAAVYNAFLFKLKDLDK